MTRFLSLLLSGMACATAVGQLPGIPSDNLISWYDFAGSTEDAHLFQAHFVAHSPEYVEDRFGVSNHAIQFDGSEDEMIAPDLGQYTDLNELTVAMWVKFDAYPSYQTQDGGHALFMKSEPVGANAVVSFQIFTEFDENALRFDTRFSNGTQINLRFESFSESLDLATWHHLVCRFDGTKNQIFWDGALAAESATFPELPILNTTYDIMTSTSFGNVDRWQGSLDDLGTWSRALTLSEIETLYAWTPAQGCMDSEACNYDSEALIDDGSCHFNCQFCLNGTIWDEAAGGCIGNGSGDINNDGCVQLGDLLDLLGDYGSCESDESTWQCGDPLEYQGYDYSTVQIGEQCWFAENLRSGTFRNGDSIESELTDSLWTITQSPAVAVYGEGSSNCSNFVTEFDACEEVPAEYNFGYLYNGYVVSDEREVCPSGWSIPPMSSFFTLVGNYEDLVEAATALKSESTWAGEENNGNNLSGFNGFAAGFRRGLGTVISESGYYDRAGVYGNFWAKESSGEEYLMVSGMSLTPQQGVELLDGNQLAQVPGGFGFSIRCIKDSE